MRSASAFITIPVGWVLRLPLADDPVSAAAHGVRPKPLADIAGGLLSKLTD
ncbi:hypothetical protein D9M70_632230 [compost metagenome]